MTQPSFLERAAAGDEAAYRELAQCALAAAQVGAMPAASATLTAGIWEELACLVTGGGLTASEAGRVQLTRAARGDLSAIEGAADTMLAAAAGSAARGALNPLVAAECLLRLGAATDGQRFVHRLADVLLWRGLLELNAGEAGHLALIEALSILHATADQGDAQSRTMLIEAMNGPCVCAWKPVLFARPSLLAFVRVAGAA